MRLVIQRVSEASVMTGDHTVAQIGPGLVILVGVGEGDQPEDARVLARKVLDLRILEDEAGKLNLSPRETGAELLAVSQFTLYADTSRGRRPSFVHAAAPEVAWPLFDLFVSELQTSGNRVQTGTFGQRMLVRIANDGPVTIILRSESLS